MIKDNAKILVIDTNVTSWNHPTRRKSEVLSIVWCFVHFDKQIGVYPEMKIIKPHYGLSEFCSEITHISQRDAQRGMSFEDACRYFVNKMGFKKYLWASFGTEVKDFLKKQCEDCEAPFFLSESHIDISDLASVKLQIAPRSSMLEYLEKSDAEYIQEPQDILDLVQNAATLLQKLLQ